MEKSEIILQSEIIPLEKKIKKRKAIKGLEISKNFQSFYTGGKITITKQRHFLSLYQNKICFYDLKEKKVFHEIEHENEEINNFEYITDKKNKYLFTFTKNGILRKFRIIIKKNEVETFLINKKKFIKFLAVEIKLDKSRKFIILVDPSGEIKIIEEETLKVLREFKLGMGYIKIRLVNNFLLFLSKERNIIFYNMVTNQRTKIIKTKNQIALSDFILLDSKNKILLMSGFDNNLYIYDTINKVRICDYKINGFVIIMESIKIGKKTLILLGYEKGLLELVIYDNEKKSFKKMGEFLTKNIHMIEKIIFDFISQCFYVITDESEIYELKLKKKNESFDVIISDEFVGLNDQILDIKFIDVNNFIVCSNSETIRHIKVDDNSGNFLFGHKDLVTCCDVFENKMVTGCKDGTIFLWEISKVEGKYNFEIVKKYKGHLSDVVNVVIGKKANFFISADTQGFVKLWNLDDKSCKTIKSHNKELNFIRLSKNDKIFATGSHDRSINLYSTQKMELLGNINAHSRGVWDCDFDFFTQNIVSCSSDMLIKIWDIKDPRNSKQVKTLEGSTSAILRVKWILLGLEILSASADGVITLWNVKKGTQLANYEKHQGRIWALDVFERNGDFKIISGDNDNCLFLWDDNTDLMDKEQIFRVQENIIVLDKLKIFINENKFGEALRYCFEKNLSRKFFEVVNKWINFSNNKSEIIYNVDLEINKKNEENNTENEIKLAVMDIWKEDKTKLLVLVKNFITVKKFAVPVQTILKLILIINKVNQLTDLNDELKEKDTDLEKLLKVYQIFNERNLLLTRRDLKFSHYLKFMINRKANMI